MVRSLFHDAPLDQHLNTLLARVPSAVQDLTESEIRDNPPMAAQQVIDALAPHPLSIDLAHPKTEPFETTLTSRNDFTGQPDRIPAVGVRATVPFKGSQNLLELRPSSSEGGWWPTGEIYADSVRIEVVAAHLHAEEARTTLSGCFEKLQHYVDYVNADLANWQPRLDQAVRQAISERSDRLRGGDDLRGLFD